METFFPEGAEDVRATLLKASPNAEAGVFWASAPDPITEAWRSEQRAPLQIGALKALAFPFLKALNEISAEKVRQHFENRGLTFETDFFRDAAGHYYPWPLGEQITKDPLAPATAGQLKLLFSFEPLDFVDEENYPTSYFEGPQFNPYWWNEIHPHTEAPGYGFIAPDWPQDDEASVSLGHLRHAVTVTTRYLDDVLPGGAGPDINALAEQTWFLEGDEHEVLTRAELRAAVRMIYDRIAEVYPSGPEAMDFRAWVPSSYDTDHVVADGFEPLDREPIQRTIASLESQIEELETQLENFEGTEDEREALESEISRTIQPRLRRAVIWHESADYWQQNKPASPYPWSDELSTAEGGTPASFGDLKLSFSFELPAVRDWPNGRYGAELLAQRYGDLTLGFFRTLLVEHTSDNWSQSRQDIYHEAPEFWDSVAQNPGFKIEDDTYLTTLNYDLYHPKLPAGAKAPLLISLHGSPRSGPNQIGNNNRSALMGLVSQGRTRAHLLYPRSAHGRTKINEVIDNLLAQRSDIDPDRIYLTGFSLGAWTTMELIRERPHRFAAVHFVGAAPTVRSTDPPIMRRVPFLMVRGSTEQVVGLSAWENVYSKVSRFNPATTALYVPGEHTSSQRFATSRHEHLEWLYQFRRPQSSD